MDISRQIKALLPLDRCVIRLMTIFHLPVTRTELLKVLQKCAPPTLGARSAWNHQLDLALKRLSGMNLVLEEKISRGVQGVRLPPAISWEVMEDAVSDAAFGSWVASVQETTPAVIQYTWGVARAVSFELCLREIRIGLFSNDLNPVRYFIGLAEKAFPDSNRPSPLVRLCLQPFRPGWFSQRTLTLQAEIFSHIFIDVVRGCLPFQEIMPVLEAHRFLPIEEHGPHFRHFLIVFLLLSDRLDEARSVLHGELPVEASLCLRSWLLCLQGEYERAIPGFEESLRGMEKGTKGKGNKPFLRHPSGPFFILALLKTGNRLQRRTAMEYMDRVFRAGTDPFRHAYEALFAIALVMDNRVRAARSWLDRDGFGGMESVEIQTIHRQLLAGSGPHNLHEMAPFCRFFHLLAHYWVDPEQARQQRGFLQELTRFAEGNGQRWMARESQALWELLEGREVADKQTIVTMMRPKEVWEWALDALESVAGELCDSGSDESVSAPHETTRLIWLLSIPKAGHCFVQAKEQKWSGKGEWTRGRVLTWRGLRGLTLIPGKLSPQDMKLCAAVEVDYNRYGVRESRMDAHRLLPLLVGHPLVFWEEEPTVNVEMVAGEPELCVREENGKLLIRFSEDATRLGAYAVREGPNRCRVIEILPRHKEVAEILGKGLEIPGEERERVLRILPGLSTLATLQSEIGGVGEHLPEVAATDRPRIHMMPSNQGLKVRIMTRPFGDEGPWLLPGEGAATLIAEVSGRRVQTTRDLSRERERAEGVLKAAPSLRSAWTREWEWSFEDPQSCLQLLSELHDLEEGVEPEWPEGERLRVTRSLSLGSMVLRFERHKDWFAVEGSLQVDESLVIGLQELLKRMEGAEGRFVPLGEGRYLALTEEFRKRLVQLEAFTQGSGGKRHVHPLALGALEPLLREVGSCHVDAEWEGRLERLRQLHAWTPELPSTFTAELREYQKEGVRWLARLSAWGAGACLADDMGLGKTLQALALLVMRAPEGPALVVAPTSVCMNWLDESRRWAPTLNVQLFGGLERQEMLDGLGPFDLLVCSYGLLQNESERFAKVSWHSVVLDEAQAIKNRMTKRSKAVMELNSAFRMVTTGTPIENHLGELWNIFRFINPGLLGSLERFNRRFAIPIERDRQDEARLRLKSLIRPFVLRRLKSQVLDELPPRTEITLRVEMDDEERAFYEALRRNAVERLSGESLPDEERRFQILAEIMRLRRACCHPTLVVPESGLSGAKLSLFKEVVDELLANGHKALVFSQFTGYLAIIRELLDRKKIAYQYLDGATAPVARREAVQAFQSGSGDLFLISLKAGGLGLNLTAADYVIHMDPWWNPAVEDQASDRAHRFGQQRPVTVYRLVIRESIEEKIVDLHRHKRDLADGLLEGGQIPGTISAEELMRLLTAE
ncbi:MAG: DEAD/DEAH box helicase [Magnetococcales bacterium]|nr:DEAD/DEAH box helicase [Magnetococcales bacterium]NGZ06103.1 DEAD/DEAH box helicase [Magnetococcales bacterium]